MVSNNQMKKDLTKIYLEYLDNPDNKDNRKKAHEFYVKYFNGANTLFNESISKAIWGSFNLSEGKLLKKEAEKILEDLEE
ncbi:hypothetical protein KAJ87_04220 [Candidatus Pacearchaeota archaeon]|nr:hypothetical protein [Candidatus Pacearchaeota archaeon]